MNDNYEGYLFGFFIGEQSENSEQIYFAVSKDGLNFRDLNDGKPVLISNVGEKGVRDPYLYRSPKDGKFYLIATDLSVYHRGGWFINEQGYYDPSTTGSPYLVLWQSDDLVKWEGPSLINVAPENAGMAWAPEMIYHEETGEYIIFFSSSIMNPTTKMKAKPNAIYYVATRDFTEFSKPKIFIDNQSDPDGKCREIIDTTILKIGEYYYSVSKDGDNAEKNGGIRILRTKTLLDCRSWEKVLDLDELGLCKEGLGINNFDNGDLEGPEIFEYNKKDRKEEAVPEYGIILDRFRADLGYLPFKTTDIEDRDNSKNSWKVLKNEEYSFGSLKKRHGTILNITKEEIDRLESSF